MALKPLNPAPKVPLTEAWELVASAAKRGKDDTRGTIALFNGDVRAMRTLYLGDDAAQQALGMAFGKIAQIDPDSVVQALVKLIYAVEGTLRQMDDSTEGKGQSQATRLVELAEEHGIELFHTPDEENYATIEVDGHKETWPLKVKGFRNWLKRLFYTKEQKSPSSQAIRDAIGVLEGKAQFDGSKIPVYTRIAEYNGSIYVDLVNEAWQAVEIRADGWQVIAEAPVKFRRARGMLPLPVPQSGENLDVLRSLVNVKTQEDWCLLVSWLIAALRPTGPYPVLVIHGEQGSAKSTLVRLLRALIDPNMAALRTTPRDEHDLVIAATNGWLIAMDNLSHLSDWLSDALCRLATGSGFATRELYSNAEEAIFAAQRPIVMNGIAELATRADLLDRAILLYLPTIPEGTRRQEKDFWHTFEQAKPGIVGALLVILSAALAALPHTTLEILPRMADFAQWACAAAPACGWTAQYFLNAYTEGRKAATDVTLDASPVATVVQNFITSKRDWEGTATELLAELDAIAGEKITKQKIWPKTGRVLSNAIRRLAPTLRAVGVDVTFEREAGGSRRRTIRLALTEEREIEVF